MQGKIYLLRDPITLLIRYIGQTKLELEERLYHHWRDRIQKKNENNHKANWVNRLWEDYKVKPIIELIEEVTDEDLNSKERYWIDYYLNLGFDLTNTSGRDYIRVYNKKHKTTGKIVYTYDKNYKLFIYQTARIAEKELNISYKKISSMCNGKYYNCDYVFSFLELTNEEIDSKFKGSHRRDIIIGTNLIDKSELEFASQIEAGKELKCNFRNINLCLKGIRNSAGGYSWRYKE